MNRKAMKNRNYLPLVLGAMLLLATPAWATLVSWNLNPNGVEGPVGSSNYTFTSSGYSITAYGYTVGSPNTPLGLYFKNQGYDETGLGIVGPSDHELQGSNWIPQQFIQLSVASILSQGFTKGQLQIGSVQSSSNDTFRFYGSNTQGTLGTPISGIYTSTSDLKYLNVGSWGSYQYIAVAALTGDVLPVEFCATIAPVPEASALAPIISLVAAVAITRGLRNRKLRLKEGDKAEA
jgi:hypothetical protein